MLALGGADGDESTGQTSYSELAAWQGASPAIAGLSPVVTLDRIFMVLLVGLMRRRAAGG